MKATETRQVRNLGDTFTKLILMRTGKHNNKHGVGIMLNTKWRQRTVDTEYINKRAITATIVANRQRIKLMSVYYYHSGCADHHNEKLQKMIQKHTTNCKNIHTDCWKIFQCRTGTWSQHLMCKCWQTQIQRGKQKR